MKKRRLKGFALGMIIYIIIALLFITTVDIIVWRSLYKYQKKYDEACAASNPDDFMKKWVDNLDYNTLFEYLSKDDTIVYSPYENKENAWKVIADKLHFDSKISYKRDEKWKEMSPVYDLISDGEQIAVLIVTRNVNTYKNIPDEFAIKKVIFGNFVTPGESRMITLKEKDSLYVNGILVKDEYIKSKTVENAALTECSKYCGEPYKVVTYLIDDLYIEPEILVKDSEDTTLIENAENDYSSGLYKGVVNELTDVAAEKVFEYMRYYNLNIEYKDYIGSTLVDTPMRTIVDDVKSGLKWKDKAITMTLKNEDVHDIVCYNKNSFSAKVELSYYMKFEKFSKNENVSYECVFAKYNDKWYIVYISVI